MKTKEPGWLILNAVFVPAVIAYTFAMAEYVTVALVMYLCFVVVSYGVGVFEHLREWPRVTKVALAAGPVMVALGCGFSLIRTSYYMLIPAFIYLLLIAWGGGALSAKYDKRGQ
jgi:hypothetical protein